MKVSESKSIPKNWSSEPFKTISSMKGRIGWQGLNQSEFTSNIDDPFLITGMNFKDGEIRWNEVYHVSNKRYEIAKEIQLKRGDVLMTKDGTIGKILYVDEIPYPGKATLNSHLLVFRPKGNKYYPKFLYYQLISDYFRKFIEENKYGTTFFGISQEIVGKYNVVLPDISEQTIIAISLSNMDELISNLEKLIEKKRMIKQGVIQDLLKPKNGWQSLRICDIAEVIGGSTPKTNILEYWNGNINWFTPTEIGLSKYVADSERKISSAGLSSCSARLLPVGTILLTSRAGIGDLGILTNVACTNQGFQSLVMKEGFSNEFVYYLMCTLKPVLLQYASGSTFLEISPNKLRNIEIKMPNLSTQVQIAKILGDIDNDIYNADALLRKYIMIKQGMMQSLLTGKIRLI
jgi:type I restriction enzyme, S subunit